jgi:regulator of sirC expression with transglutaminase-like and TPR domain
MRIKFSILVVVLAYFSQVAMASEATNPTTQSSTIVPAVPGISDSSDLLQFLVSQPENEIDLLWSALVVDKYINPEIDVERTYHQIEGMANQIKLMIGRNASMKEKISAIRKYVYSAGAWNNHASFSYDFDNPQGRLAVHKTLDYYLTSRRGNCVSMPLLFLVLAEQLDVEMTLITAPRHLQVQYIDPDTGKAVNLETTSGVNPSRPEWLKTQLHWNDRAVETGMYLKPLTKKQIVAEMGATLLQRLHDERQDYKEDIDVALVMLEKYPESDVPLLHLYASSQQILAREFAPKYETLNLMSPEVRAEAIKRVTMRDKALDALTALGYRFPSQ